MSAIDLEAPVATCGGDCLDPPSLRPSASHDRVASAHSISEQRWSEVVPPDAALGFVAVFDPAEGLMTFSGARLLSSTATRHTSLCIPSDEASDGHSQILTVDPVTVPSNSNTATLAFFRENFDSKTPIFERYKQAVTRASSMTGGLDVYTREQQHTGRGGISRIFKPSRHWSLFSRLNQSLVFDPQLVLAGIPLRDGNEQDVSQGFNVDRDRQGAELVSDEGFFEGRRRRISGITDSSAVLVELNLSSAFSVSTSSTSDYVYVEANSENGSLCSWSTVEAPSDQSSSPASTQTTAQRRRCLRKRHRPPQHQPAPPSEVLARTEYAHAKSPLSESTTSAGRSSDCGGLKRIAVRLARLRSAPPEANGGDQWVRVDVTQVITQHLVE